VWSFQSSQEDVSTMLPPIRARRAALLLPEIQPARDPEACLRRASDLLEEGGLKDAAFWTRLAADYIAEKRREH
jgi:hypothetical protein